MCIYDLYAHTIYQLAFCVSCISASKLLYHNVYLSRMDFPTLINWRNPFQFKGYWVVFYSNYVSATLAHMCRIEKAEKVEEKAIIHMRCSFTYKISTPMPK